MSNLNRQDENYFTNAKDGTFITDIAYSETGRESLAISTPIKTKDGNFLGVLVAVINTEELNKIVFDRTGLGETGESYLINKEGYAITSLASRSDPSLKFKIDSQNSKDCLEDLKQNSNGNFYEAHNKKEIFLNYRGENVIGAHYAIKTMNWCLLAEIDEFEILGEQKEIFQKVSLTIIFFITIIISIIGFFIGRQIDKRVIFKKGKKRL